MKLAIPKKIVGLDGETPDGERVMTMGDWCTLQRVMAKFDSFEHLESYLRKGNIEQHHALRHIDVLEWLDEARWPKGCKLRDVFTSVLNVFGDEYEKKGVMPPGLAFDYVLAKGADDMAVTERTFKSQLKSLIKAKHLDLTYGNIIFPAVKGSDADKET